ncbi:MAG TPA: PqqD family protein [Anaerolineaceae bacterium]
MNPLSKPMRKPEFRLELVDEDILLYDPAGEKILNFNQTATLIWQLCDGTRTVEDMIDLLQKAYPEAADMINDDVQSTLQEFEVNGCIQEA